MEKLFNTAESDRGLSLVTTWAEFWERHPGFWRSGVKNMPLVCRAHIDLATVESFDKSRVVSGYRKVSRNYLDSFGNPVDLLRLIEK